MTADPTSLYILEQMIRMNFDELDYPEIEVENIPDENDEDCETFPVELF